MLSEKKIFFQNNKKMENKNSGLRSSKIDKIEEFDEPLAMPGKIFLAEIHGSAQHFLKIKKLSKYIRFSKLPLKVVLPSFIIII